MPQEFTGNLVEPRGMRHSESMRGRIMTRKRQRAHRGSEHWTLDEDEDHVLQMDPSLMTERQQMAFLLRTTAHEGLKTSRSSDESSEDETGMSLRHVKKSKWIPGEKHEATATSIHRGRGRPLKNKKRLNGGNTKLRVKAEKKKHKAMDDKKVENKPSPVSSDDVSQLNAARSLRNKTPQCALCCDYDTAHEASYSNVLFLCPSCDRKYPTQQALGRRACVI
ncbi:unnamed protein product [Peronospora belbahrii]|uniref:Uncharacterized protein n=1 Tax=Peronospora belbahrii TaxID=622444 RepID=A0AAU9LMD0_9STRA|nr:unnamed protein product [Peronospora belbahrii]CAH0522618.1 unnamed protein product [Peronospora belbahrii]